MFTFWIVGNRPLRHFVKLVRQFGSFLDWKNFLEEFRRVSILSKCLFRPEASVQTDNSNPANATPGDWNHTDANTIVAWSDRGGSLRRDDAKTFTTFHHKTKAAAELFLYSSDILKVWDTWKVLFLLEKSGDAFGHFMHANQPLSDWVEHLMIARVLPDRFTTRGICE